MVNGDAIRFALDQPIDWEKFEVMVCDILAEDDLPRLRKFGGRHDHGLDGYQDSYYSLESKSGPSSSFIAVQVSSQKAQKVKVSDTLKKLKENNISANTLVMVFRDECSSTVARQLASQGLAHNIAVDVRDRDYLARRLGLSGSKIFSRHLGTDIRTQVNRLLEVPDPLAEASDTLKKSIFVAMATYALSANSRLVKGKLFERTVLGIIASSRDGIEKHDLLKKVRGAHPERRIEDEQLNSAISGLRNSSEIEFYNGRYQASTEALGKFGRLIESVDGAYSYVQEWVAEQVKRQHAGLSDAVFGYVEKNVKDALVYIIRLIGPNKTERYSIEVNGDVEVDLHRLLSKNVGPDLGRTVLAAIAGFIEDAEHNKKLAPFVRAYAALAIRNVDPVGKQWQSNVLRRKIMALDTDAVLKLIIEDLPEHQSVKIALEAFSAEGVEIAIPQSVFDETLDHIQRSPITYNRFQGSIGRLPLPAIDTNVWNAVVRGYAYALSKSSALSWDSYLDRYLDLDEGRHYLAHTIKRLVNYKIIDTSEVAECDVETLRSLTEIMQRKEENRLKASFRGDDLKVERIDRDLKMLLFMAETQSGADYVARGYLVTEDYGLFKVENSEAWRPRPKVATMTSTLPFLAEFVCGARLDDNDVVRLVFEPITVATAQLLKPEIDWLTEAGGLLQDQSMNKLEWSLSKGLRSEIHEFNKSLENGAAPDMDMQFKALGSAVEAGIKLRPDLEEAVQNYHRLKQVAESDRAELEKLKSDLMASLYEVAGDSSKGRARANRVLGTLNLDVSKKPL